VNGDIYKGKIIKDVVVEYIIIELRDGSIKKCLYSEIAKREVNDISQFNVPQPKIKQMTFGIKSGISYSTFIGDDASGFDYKSGFIFDAFVSYPIRNHASIQPELLYAQHGAILKDSLGDISVNIDIVAIPLTVIIEIPLFDRTKMNFNPGFGLGLNMTTYQKAKIDEKDISYDFTKKIEKLVVFLSFGISLDSYISEDMKLIFDWRANSSFNTLLKNYNQVKDLSFYFTLGFGF
jgi:hypothetical protein